ncbi:hypothetical protein HII13_004027 [Brettanomyces bruxellensis]|nr:hypothetical protein HII13_004027 [Brettanomyces bruxellensis]
MSSVIESGDPCLYVGNLDEKVDEGLLYELFLQFAPLRSVYIPKDRVLQRHQGYGFVRFYTLKDAVYSMHMASGIQLYDRSLRVKQAMTQRAMKGNGPGSNAQLIKDDIGPVVYIGNLDTLVDVKLLVRTFKNFGKIAQVPQLIRTDERDTCYAFIVFDSFETADKAIEEMNGKMILNRPANVNYAFKNGSKTERHGNKVERLLYEKAKENHFNAMEDDSQQLLLNILASDDTKSAKSSKGENTNDRGKEYHPANTERQQFNHQQHSYQGRRPASGSQYRRDRRVDNYNRPDDRPRRPQYGGYNSRGRGGYRGSSSRGYQGNRQNNYRQRDDRFNGGNRESRGGYHSDRRYDRY